jgi:L-ribulose-5-phosphate 4-epimerase
VDKAAAFDCKQEIILAAHNLVASGIMTRSNHGNISLRIPGTEGFLLTSGGGLGDMTPDTIALFDLEGNLLEGTVNPVGAEIVQMHAVVYRIRPEFMSVLHTHSPFATGFAVAGQPIPLAYEALVRSGMTNGVPVASYGPRGSQESVENIAAVLNNVAPIRALLLENHGVLTFGDTAQSAVQANFVIEEAAEIIEHAMNVGIPKLISTKQVKATRSRQATYAAAGSYSTTKAPTVRNSVES